MKPGRPLIKVLIFLFPILLVGMVIGGILLYEKRRIDQDPQNPIAREVTIKGMSDHYSKLRDFMSPRGFSDEAELLRLTRTKAFIEGSISTMNTGMHVESHEALTKAGKLWNSSTIKFGDGGERVKIHVNYVEASNAEVMVGVVLAEALPQRALSTEVEITFSPRGETSAIVSEWVSEARKSAEGQPLYQDGIDWEYLRIRMEQYIKSL